MRNDIIVVLLGHFIQTYAEPDSFHDFFQLSNNKRSHGSHWDWGQPWDQHDWFQGPHTTQRVKTRKSTTNQKLTTRFHAKTTSDPVAKTETSNDYNPFNFQDEVAMLSLDERDKVFTTAVSEDAPTVGTLNEQVTSVNTRIDTPFGEDSSSHWHVGIYRTTVTPYIQICGGSLIKADIVISAGHCFWTLETELLPADQFAAAAGKIHRAWDDARDLKAQYSNVKKIVVTRMLQPCFDPDLALVTLATPFRFQGAVKPVCLEITENENLTTKDTGLIAGWAIPSEGCKLSERIIWSYLPFVHTSNCSLGFGNNANKICAGDTTSKTQCDTDRGSGLVFYNKTIPYLRGVAAFVATNSTLCSIYRTPSFSRPGRQFWLLEDTFERLWKNFSSLEECKSLYQTDQLQNETIDVQTGQLYTGEEVVTSVNLTFTIPPEEEDIILGALGTGSTPVPTLGNTSAPAFEWHVGVYSKAFTPFMQICGGTLVKLDVVISAAHCFWDDAGGQQPAPQFSVAGGKLYRPWNSTKDTFAQLSDVSEITIPARFRGETTSFQDDVAILRLSSTFSRAPGVRPACVDFREALEREQLSMGNLGTVAGWGLTKENGSPSQRLNYLELPYVEINDCFDTADPSFLKYITSDKICAGDQITGKALCRGDSGGGLILFSGTTPYLRGVASTAPNNNNLCNAFAIATFTQLYAHRTFLRDNIPGVDKCNETRHSAEGGTGNGGERVPFGTGNGFIGADRLEMTGNSGAQTGSESGAGRVPFGTGNSLLGGNRLEMTGNSGAQSGTSGSGERAPFGTGYVGNGKTSKPPESVTIEGPIAASKMTEAPSVPAHLLPYNNFVCNCNCKN